MTEVYDKSNTVTVDPETVFIEPMVPDVDLTPINILGMGVDRFEQLRSLYKNLDYGKTDHGRKWTESLKATGFNAVWGDRLHNLGDREGSDWQRSLDYQGIPIQPIVPDFSDRIQPGERLTGAAATIRIRSLLGLGSTLRLPLYHSAFWVELQCPTDAQLFQMVQMVANEKTELGSQSYGRIFTAANVYHAKHITDLACNLIIDSNLENWENLQGGLQSIISIKDIQTLSWGLAALIHQNGYPMSQPCVADPSKCQNIDTSILNLQRCLWVDRNRVPKEVLAAMYQPNERIKLERVKELQALMDEPHVFNINEDIVARLKTPSISKYIEAGYQWFSELASQVDRAFSDFSKEERRRYLIGEASLATLRYHSHWFDVLHVQGGIVDDSSDIRDSITYLSEDPEKVELVVKELTAMIEKSMISMVAIPQTTCSKCNKPSHRAINPRHPSLITLDAMKTFFTLAVQKYSQGTLKKRT